MNDTDVKELFASVAANPAADTIDMDAVLRGGRRRHRTRVAATLGASVGALAVVGALLSGVLPGGAPTPVGPSPTATPSPALRVSAEELVGTWRLTGEPRGSGGTVPGVSATLRFAADGTWQESGAACMPSHGTFTVAPDGRFTAEEIGQITSLEGAACLRLRPDITQASEVTVTGESSGRRTLTMRSADGEVVAVWASSSRVEIGCQGVPAGGAAEGSIQDQEDVDAAAERVRQTARVQAVNGYASLAVDSGNRTVILWWVGSVPEAVAELARAEKGRGITLEIREAAYTQSQMSAAMKKVWDIRLPAGYTVTLAAGCNDGSGVWVGVADGSGGVPSVVPASVGAALQDALRPMPVQVLPLGPVVPAAQTDAVVDPASWAACTKLAGALEDAGIQLTGFGPSRGFIGIELMGPRVSVDLAVQDRARQIAKDVIGDSYTILFVPDEDAVLF